jgi:hypothetical protein
MLLELVEPMNISTRNSLRKVVHGAYDFDTQRSVVHILAKLIVTDGFAKISEEMVHVVLNSPTTVQRLRFRILNPDFSLVDFHGRDNNFTLLMRASEGHTTGLPVA